MEEENADGEVLHIMDLLGSSAGVWEGDGSGDRGYDIEGNASLLCLCIE